jgi:hypothetical protein
VERSTDQRTAQPQAAALRFASVAFGSPRAERACKRRAAQQLTLKLSRLVPTEKCSATNHPVEPRRFACASPGRCCELRHRGLLVSVSTSGESLRASRRDEFDGAAGDGCRGTGKVPAMTGFRRSPNSVRASHLRGAESTISAGSDTAQHCCVRVADRGVNRGS